MIFDVWHNSSEEEINDKNNEKSEVNSKNESKLLVAEYYTDLKNIRYKINPFITQQ